MISVPIAVKNPSPREGFPSRVLVIDDEPLIRWSLSVGLTAAGFDTTTVASPSDARRAAGARPQPDVILLDIHQADSSRLLDDLRAAAPCARVLVLGTCCNGDRERWQGFEVIAKPFDLAHVIAKVQQAVAS